jgi:hypothetical protein
MSITGAESISQNGRSAYRKLSIELWDNSGVSRADAVADRLCEYSHSPNRLLAIDALLRQE